MPLPAIAFGPILKSVGTFIAANWKLFLLGAIILGLWWKYHSMQDEIEDLKEDKTELTAQNQALDRDNKRLESIIDMQTLAIGEIAHLSEKMDARMAKLGDSIAAQRREFVTRLDKLRDAPAPQTAEESVDYIIEGLPYLRSGDKQ